MDQQEEKKELGHEGIGVHLSYIVRDLAEIKKMQRENWDDIQKVYVTKDEFSPVKRVVYGLVTLALSSMGVALLSLIFKT